VTLSSETGRRRMQTECPTSYQASYHFEGLAPGVHEVFAELQGGTVAGFTELYLDHDMNGVNLQVMPTAPAEFEVRRASSYAELRMPIKVFGRRQDLAEVETEQEIKLPRATLSPGHWEMRAVVPAGQYVESIESQRGSMRRASSVDHPPDWFEVYIDSRYNRIQISVSKAATITGKVTADGKPAPGAPVFLWPVAESARRSLNGPMQTLTDVEGRFRFDSLPPGDYRALASFDVNEVDADLMEMSQAAVVHANASQTATVDLTMWVAPW
jgi:hypothetical protein